MAFVFMLFVVEAAVTADVFLNHSWQEVPCTNYASLYTGKYFLNVRNGQNSKLHFC